MTAESGRLMSISPFLRTAVDPENARPGWIALGIVVALGVATYLLWRSMNRQLNKITVPPRGATRAGPDASAPREEPDTAEASPPAAEPPSGDRDDVPRPLDPADGSGAAGGQDPPHRS